MTRASMFHLLARQSRHAGRGMRIIGTNGVALAWWGEDLRVTGAVTYQFGVLNGSYTVNLKFAELYFTTPGNRTLSRS